MEQIIDENGNIVDHLEQQITKSGLAKDGIDYHTLAIIGCQSSGKSTLLNLLFGTKFLTMNDQIGRQQTTKGIHAAKATNSELLVFDVEGSDSRERGDADALFERKSSLFALALSEVLIINMWESDIGRYNAANLPMLKTVFEMNVQLFLAENQVKSKIIFVIRDCTAPNFEAITFQIERDMQNIWDEIEIPEKLSGKHITDFFEFEFFPIHHMLIEKSKFDDDISTLRKWFIDKTYKDYVFNDKSDKVVPGEGLSQYIINLWTVINENKELNIPSQKTMLARFKCDENAKLALEQLTNELTPTVFNILDVSEKPLDHFKEICDKAFNLKKIESNQYVLINRERGARRFRNMNSILEHCKKSFPEYKWIELKDFYKTINETAKIWASIKFAFMPTGSNVVKMYFMHPGTAICVGEAETVDNSQMRSASAIGIFSRWFYVEGMIHDYIPSFDGWNVNIPFAIENIKYALYAAKYQKWPSSPSFTL